jgi:site-specific recombinase XerD
MHAIESIFQYKSCKQWLDGKRSNSTKKAYACHMLLFCRFHHTDPDKLVKLSPGEIKQMVIEYILQLKKTCKNSAGKPKMGEISANSIKLYLAGIQSFLEEHEIILPWKKIAKYCPEDVSNDYRSYNRQEISKLLSIADLRDRCIILLMASSGVRVGAIPTLTVKSLKPLDQGLGLLTVYGESRKSRYVSLVTPECMSTIDAYFEERRKRGEKLSERSPLIRDKYSIYSTRINNPKSPKAESINSQIRQLIRKAGLPFEELQPDHAARKFFNTTLVNSKANRGFKELMMGHSVKLDDIYYDEDNEESRNQIILEYTKAVDALTINDEHRLRKQITDYEEKLNQVPKVEQLQEQLASRIIEEDSIKRQLERLQKEKELEAHTIQSKYEQDLKVMREEMNQYNSVREELDALKEANNEFLRLLKDPKKLLEILSKN